MKSKTFSQLVSYAILFSAKPCKLKFPLFRSKIFTFLILLQLLFQSTIYGYNYIEVSQWNPQSIGNGCPGSTFTARFTVRNISTNSITVAIPNWSESYITGITPRTINLGSGGSTDFVLTGTVPGPNTLPYHFNIDIAVIVDGHTVENAATAEFHLTSRFSPTAPANLTYSNLTSNSVTLSWTGTSPSATDGYKIFNGTTLLGTTTYTSTTVSLSSGTNYSLSVRAYNNCAESANSNVVNILTKPSTPANFRYTNLTQTGFVLAWNASPGIVNGYKIFDENNNLLWTLTGTTKTISNLCPGTTKKYKLSAYNDSGESAKTSVLTVTTPDLAALSGPIEVCSSGTFTLNNIATGYSISGWSQTPNLIFQSSAGYSATFNSNGYAEASVTVTLTSATCPTKQRVFNTWVGVPQNRNLKVDGQNYTAGMQICPGNHYLTVTPVGGNPSNATWVVPSGVTYFVGTNMLDFNLPSNLSSVAITSRSSNSCGTSSNYNFYLVKKTIGCTLSSGILAYPNPSSDYLTITMPSDEVEMYSDNTLESESKIEVEKSLEDVIYTVKLLDNYYRIIKEFQFKGKTITIPMNSVKDGYYILEVSDGKNKYTQQLVVHKK